jgi:hypothetical protein
MISTDLVTRRLLVEDSNLMPLSWRTKGSDGFAIVCAFAALGILITGGAIWLGLELGGILN